MTPAFPEIEQWAVSYQRLSGNIIPVPNHALHQAHMEAMVAWLHAFAKSALYYSDYNNHTGLQSEQNASEHVAKTLTQTVQLVRATNFRLHIKLWYENGH